MTYVDVNSPEYEFLIHATITLACVLFAIGAAAVLLRRNAIIAFMGVELMLNASNLLFVTFAQAYRQIPGQAMALLVIAVAAAEVVVGLAIIVAFHRSRQTISLDEPAEMKG